MYSEVRDLEYGSCDESDIFLLVVVVYVQRILLRTAISTCRQEWAITISLSTPELQNLPHPSACDSTTYNSPPSQCYDTI